MAILIENIGKEILFTLQTAHSTYQAKADKRGYLYHTYYGKKVPPMDMSYTIRYYDRGFSGQPSDAGKPKPLFPGWEVPANAGPDRTFSNDVIPQEFGTFGAGDYRIPALEAEHEDGSLCADLRFVSYEIKPGKYSIPNMPAVYGSEEEADTLEITLKDTASDLYVVLLYGVLAKRDVITRAVRLENRGAKKLVLKRAMSMCMDFQRSDLDLISFHGRHTMERQPERQSLRHGIVSLESVRGYSSHQMNPFAVLAAHDTTEDAGDCWGLSLVYSGNFMIQAEISQFEDTRIIAGIHPRQFAWKLEADESFSTPEMILTYSHEGFHKMSQNLHVLYRKNLMRSPYREQRRPILINNWEATYFTFDNEKLKAIVDGAAELGIEMFVLDDGWFGVRNNDNLGLGDWYVNEEKLEGGLKYISEYVNSKGMKFGLWFEPEMVNEDSDLYRAHPDYALSIPNRSPERSRNQLVLDFSRKEVVDAIWTQMKKILDSANISYVKWDVNRSMANVWSAALPSDRQGEVYHRYILGMYDLSERLISTYPDLLLEGCSGGGGRFDAGMLYYAPQIWCSDNTDAIERLRIQYGSSFGYPISSFGSHVSASPNHQTFRETPVETRGIVAMSGTFGYELNVHTMTDKEKACVKKQIAEYKKYADLVLKGFYYRLTDAMKEEDFCAWQLVSEDQSESLVSFVRTRVHSNDALARIALRGLKEDALYEIFCDTENFLHAAPMNGQKIYGAALMYQGISMPNYMPEYSAMQLYLKEV